MIRASLAQVVRQSIQISVGTSTSLANSFSSPFHGGHSSMPVLTHQYRTRAGTPEAQISAVFYTLRVHICLWTRSDHFSARPPTGSL